MFAGFTLMPLLATLMFANPGTATVSRVLVQEQWILRVPVRPRAVRRVAWEEKKGPRCIPSGEIMGAALFDNENVDFLLKGRRLVRARMDSDCPTLDFYGGFYLQTGDDKVCARRDEIRSRIGGSCRIDRFRSLVPRLERAERVP